MPIMGNFVDFKNTRFQEFKQLVSGDLKDSAVLRLNNADNKTATNYLDARSIKVSTGRGGGFLGMFRNQHNIDANNASRNLLLHTVADMFGGEDHIPDSVKNALHLNSYDKGKPLTARRVREVIAAIDSFQADVDKQVNDAKEHVLAMNTKLLKEDPAARLELTKAVDAVANFCGKDRDLLDVVLKNINKYVVNGRGKVRSGDDFERKLNYTKAALILVRNISTPITGVAAKRDEALYEAGKKFLVAMQGDVPFEAEFVPEAVKLAKKLDSSALQALKPRSSVQDICKAVIEFHKNAQAILNGPVEKFGGKDLGGDQYVAYIRFVQDLIFAKCDKATLKAIHAALTGENAAKFVATCNTIGRGTVNLSAFPDDVGDTIISLGSDLTMRVLNMTSCTAELLGLPDAPGQDYNGSISGFTGEVTNQIATFIQDQKAEIAQQQQQMANNPIED